MIFDLFSRFVLISILAFGGGGAALPLVERLAVRETGWLSSQDFAVAVACGYVMPGPVLITATFVGYRAAGLSGAVAATVSALMGLLYDHSLLALVVFSVVVQLLAVPLFWLAKQQEHPA
jgi:chromate transporter